jgi:hypothetical protein
MILQHILRCAGPQDLVRRTDRDNSAIDDSEAAIVPVFPRGRIRFRSRIAQEMQDRSAQIASRRHLMPLPVDVCSAL